MLTHSQIFPLVTEQGERNISLRERELKFLRACIGQRFARLELFTLMVKLVQTYTMEYVGDGEVGVHTRLVSVPDRKIKIKFMKR